MIRRHIRLICVAATGALLGACATAAPAGRAGPQAAAAPSDSAGRARIIGEEIRRIGAVSSDAERTSARARLAQMHADAPWLPYFEFEVDRPVRVAEGSAHPRYPAELKAANVEGEVQAQFVVDTSGRVEPGSFKVLKSSHELLTAAAREALPGMRFLPAEAKERKVRQVVQQPYHFVRPR